MKSKGFTFFTVVMSCVLSMLVFTATQAAALEDYKKYYLQGLSDKEKGNYESAIEAFASAINENGTEQKNIRFYGMRYNDYYPHREKGICHYMLKQYLNAQVEFEISLSQLPSDDTIKYLDWTKVELARLGPESNIEMAVETPEELKKPKPAAQANRYAVAVVIGNRDYKSKDISQVNYAIEDARQIKEYLIKTFGYQEGNIIFEMNATKGTLENIFGDEGNYKGRLYQYMQPEKSDVFVYYSGHGAPSLETRKGYILPVDGDPITIDIGGYPLDLLYRNLSLLKARSLTVVTDACFSGAPLFKKASPGPIRLINIQNVPIGLNIINSSSGTELSSWYPQKGHSLFTYYFLLGLTGKADTNDDGKITMGEMLSYLKDNIPYMARTLYPGRIQTPTFTVNNPDQIFVTYK